MFSIRRAYVARVQGERSRRAKFPPGVPLVYALAWGITGSLDGTLWLGLTIGEVALGAGLLFWYSRLVHSLTTTHAARKAVSGGPRTGVLHQLTWRLPRTLTDGAETMGRLNLLRRFKLTSLNPT